MIALNNDIDQHHPPERGESFLCKACNVFFPAWEALVEHREKMREAGAPGYLNCKNCGQEFETEKGLKLHVQAHHPQEQKLKCVACGAGPFTRMAALVAHIESGQCQRIDGTIIDDLRERKTEFSRRLDEMTGEPVKNQFARYMGASQNGNPASVHAAKPVYWPTRPGGVSRPASVTTIKTSGFPGSDGVVDWCINPASLDRARNGTEAATTPAAATADVILAHPEESKSNEPRLGDGISALATLNDEMGECSIVGGSSNVAAEVQISKPTKRAAKANAGNATKETIPRGLPQPSPLNGTKIVHSMDADDPGHPAFNAARYFSPYAEKYVCPKMPCGKVFKTSSALVGHLKSAAHGGRTYQCPFCLKRFKTLLAITAHAESSSLKCQIRKSDGYGAFISQLTGGLVDVGEERHNDGTIKYETSTHW